MNDSSDETRAGARPGRGDRDAHPPSSDASLDAVRRLMPADGDLWVFGYGSLMWDPGFDHTAAEIGTLFGYHRAFCMYSQRHRGTAERRGLVLALDRGGSCRGMAYRVSQDRADAVLDYLWDREMALYGYQPYSVQVRLADGTTVACATFVADRGHQSYAGRLAPDAVAKIIRRAHGGRGSNRDYLANTVRHLTAFGITDGPIHALLHRVDAMDRRGEGNRS